MGAVMDCVFCRIVAGIDPAEMVSSFADAIVIHPLNPVTPGHILIVPRRHVRDAGEDPQVTAKVMAVAAIYVAGCSSANLITSKGVAATQTVYHMHVHVVPREDGDGLHLPWTPSPH
jgi:histidine triad (HIT) family protein